MLDVQPAVDVCEKSDVIVADKTQPHEVTRRRVLKKLAEATRDTRLIVFAAEHGYGKSVCLKSFPAPANAKTISISCANFSPIEDLTRQFLRSFFDELSQAEAPDEADIPPAEYYSAQIEAIVRALKAMGDDFVFVLIDEYHVLQNDQHDKMLRYLLDKTPNNVCFVIASRDVPNCGFSRLAMSGRALLIDREDLRFSFKEARELLAPLLSKKSIALLLEATKGWPAGLVLARLWIERNKYSEKHAGLFDIELALSDIYQYFSEEVMIHIHKNHQDVLMWASLLDELDAEAVAVASDISEAPYIIKMYQTRRFFMACVDEGYGRYQLHPLFREFLKCRLFYSFDKGAIALRHKALTELFEKRRKSASAVYHALQTDDHGFIEATINKATFNLAEIAGHWEKFEGLIRPRDKKYLIKMGHALIAQAALELKSGQFEKARSYVEEAERFLPSASTEKSPLLSESATEDMTVIKAYCAMYADEDDIAAHIKPLKQALNVCSAAKSQGVVCTALAVCEVRTGDIKAGQSTHKRAADAFRGDGSGFGYVYHQCHLGRLALVQGKHSDAERLLHDAQKAAQLILPQDRHAAAVADIGFADYLCDAARLEQVVDLAEPAWQTVLKSADFWPELLTLSYNCMARATFAKNGFDDAYKLLAEGIAIAGERGYKRSRDYLFGRVIHFAVIAESDFLSEDFLQECFKTLREMDDNAAGDNAERRSVAERLGWEENFSLATGLIRFLISEYREDEAIGHIDCLRPAYANGGLDAFVMKFDILRALALYSKSLNEPASNNGREAAAAIEACMIAAHQLGCPGLLLEEGPLMQDFLIDAGRRFARRPAGSENIQKILVSFLVKSFAYCEFSRGAPEQKSDLTKNQSNIIRLAYRHFSLDRIAEGIGSSRTAVADQLSAIRSKLGARTNDEAIAKAIYLRLLAEVEG